LIIIMVVRSGLIMA